MMLRWSGLSESEFMSGFNEVSRKSDYLSILLQFRRIVISSWPGFTGRLKAKKKKKKRKTDVHTDYTDVGNPNIITDICM